jgi:hypothetical protein
MKKVILILIAGLLLTGCSPNIITVPWTPSQMGRGVLATKYNIEDAYHKYFMSELWFSEEVVAKYSWQLMPPGNKAFAVSQPRINFGVGHTYLGFSSKNIAEARKRSLNFCKVFISETNVGMTYFFRKKGDPEACKVQIVYSGDKHKKSIIEARKEYAKLSSTSREYRYIERCKDLGIETNSKKMSQCVNEFDKAESKINKKGNLNIGDLVITLLLLDAALTNSTPTTSYRRPNCIYHSIGLQATGGKGFITCN